MNMTNTIVAPNRLKDALKAGQNPVGTMVTEIRQPVIMQLLANADFDFVIIDNEHGPFSIETIADLSRTAKYVGLTPIVRVPDLSYAHLTQPLDTGAQGIMIPRVTNAEQVRDVIDMIKYPPMGHRGCALSRGHTNFLSGAVDEVMAISNEATMLIVQIETKEALDNLEEVATVPGVDALLVGPNDLAISLGIPGQFTNPILESAIQKVITACQNHQIYPAIHMNNLQLATHWLEKGMRIISSSAETSLLVQAGRELTSTIKGHVN
jgi:4-hydroxy-2-oxoheptanedioate aldolase